MQTGDLRDVSYGVVSTAGTTPTNPTTVADQESGFSLNGTFTVALMRSSD